MTRRERRIKGVIFDLDDTLIDWSEPETTRHEYHRPRIERIRQYLEDRGHPTPSPEEFYEVIDQAVTATWEEARRNWKIDSMDQVFGQTLAGIGIEVTQSELIEILQVFDWDAYPGVVLFPDTIAVLRELRRRNYITGLLTNAYMPMWMRDVELESYALRELLDVRVSSGDVGYLKPHGAMFEAILDKMHLSPQEAIMVGDRPANDIAGANDAGIISVLMDPPHLNRELDGVEPHFIINCLSDLLPILEELA